jgi:hypothetical protein
MCCVLVGVIAVGAVAFYGSYKIVQFGANIWRTKDQQQ